MNLIQLILPYLSVKIYITLSQLSAETTFINPTTMEGSNDELLAIMQAVQAMFDKEAAWLEEALLDSILCDCPRCWELYFGRLRELHRRDANLQDHREWREAEETIERFSPEIEEK